MAIVIFLVAGRAPSATSTAFLAPAPSYAGHPTIDNIQCQNTEQVAYHIHSHLAVFVDGQPRGVPEGIGIAAPRQSQNTADGPFVIAGGCFYWLHTHDRTGVIHIESPNEQPYTLGNFFDMWQQPLSASQAGPATGTLIAYVNGQRYQGDPRQIQLAAHAVIQLDVGQDVPPASYTFAPGL
ncbi:MAG: hypothetical protein ACHQ7M_15150 [Chloroflexota bacterium]